MTDYYDRLKTGFIEGNVSIKIDQDKKTTIAVNSKDSVFTNFVRSTISDVRLYGCSKYDYLVNAEIEYDILLIKRWKGFVIANGWGKILENGSGIDNDSFTQELRSRFGQSSGKRKFTVWHLSINKHKKIVDTFFKVK